MSSSSIFKATVLITVMTFISRIFGFIRESVFANYYGIGREADFYFVALLIPNLVSMLVQGILVAIFIPMYSQYKNKSASELNRFTNIVLVWTLLSTTLISVFIYILLPFIIGIIVPGFSEDDIKLTNQLGVILLPLIILGGLVGFFTSLHQANKVFIFSAMGGLPFNFFIILGLVVYAKTYGIYVAAVANCVAVFMQLILLLIGTKKLDFKYEFIFSFSYKEFKTLLVIVSPIVISTILSQCNLIVDRMLASQLAGGSIAALSYANRVYTVFMALLVTPMSTVLFPSFTECIVKQDFKRLRQLIEKGIIYLGFLVIPIMSLIIVFNIQIIEVLFQRGMFDINATKLTGSALMYYSIGMLGFALLDVFNKLFYAFSDTRTPMIIMIGTVALNIILNLILVHYMAHSGLALAYAISGCLGGIICIIFYYYRYALGLATLARKSSCFLLASCIMSFISWVFYNFLYQYMNSVQNQMSYFKAIVLCISISIGAVTYILTLILMKSEELLYLYDKIKYIVFHKFNALFKC